MAIRKLIANALGENDYETISNPDAKFVAKQLWTTCVKPSAFVCCDYRDVHYFLVGNYDRNQIKCDKAVYASVGRGKSLEEAILKIYKNPFINEIPIRYNIKKMCCVMLIITLKSEDLSPAVGEISQAIEKVSNRETDCLWQLLVDSEIQENVRVSLIFMKNKLSK